MVRLYELSDEEHKDIISNEWDLPANVANWLKSKGLTSLGDGTFSRVYGKEGTNKVVKINYHVDTAFKKAAEYISEHPSKNLPIIYDTKSIGEGNLFLYIMEKLKPFKGNYKFKESDIPFISFLADDNDMTISDLGIVNEFLEVMKRMYKEEKDNPDMTEEDFNDYYFDEFVNDKIIHFAGEYRNSPDGKILTTLLDNNRSDIHSGNIMIRPSTGDIVISDPIVNMRDLSNARQNSHNDRRYD